MQDRMEHYKKMCKRVKMAEGVVVAAVVLADKLPALSLSISIIPATI